MARPLTNLLIILLAAAISGVSTSLAGPDVDIGDPRDPVVDSRVVTEPHGGWHYVWIHKPMTNAPPNQSQPSEPTNSSVSSAGGRISGGNTGPSGGTHPQRRHQKVTDAQKKKAENCLSNSADDLKTQARNIMHKSVSDRTIQNGLDAIDHAQLISDKEFDKMISEDPVASKTHKHYDGYTLDGRTYLRQSTWDNANSDFTKKAELLAHEGMHAILQSSGSSTLIRQNPANEDWFIEKFLTDHCFP